MKKFLLLLVVFPVCVLNAQESRKITRFLTAVVQEDHTGLKKGKEWIMKPASVYLNPQKEGVYIHTNSDKVGLVSGSGTWIFDTLYTSIQFVEVHLAKKNGFILVNDKNEYAFFSAAGKQLIPFAYHEFDFYKNYIVLLKGDYQALYDYEGHVIIPENAKQIEVVELPKCSEIRLHDANGASVFLERSTSIPPLLAYVDHDFAISKKEVSISDYCLFLASLKFNEEFLIHLSVDSVPGIETFFPDTSVLDLQLQTFWRAFINKMHAADPEALISKKYPEINARFTFYEPFKFTDHERKLASLPVSAITYESAVWYTRWLTYIFDSYPLDSEGINWKFDLPTQEQWNKAFQSGLEPETQQAHISGGLVASGCSQFNDRDFKQCKELNELSDWYQFGKSIPVGSLRGDKNGCYHLVGNCAEMLSEEGLAIGGSFIDSAKEAQTGQVQRYSAPQEWLGFRVIGVKKEGNY